ncbi:MAG TPA: hypothetical protein P5268_04455 [Candidatus Marinimicrobia bacterium]|nr:hypothetical protein [Candidatus Neomarinimicrobiota bacterium]
MKFVHLLLEIESIIIGERFKGGVFRPCQTTIPSSTIDGAFKHYLGIEVKAVGLFIEGTYEIKEFTYSIRDKALGISKMPIFAQYLSPYRAENAELLGYESYSKDKILANIYIVPENNGYSLIKNLSFQMGALKSKGFGKCQVVEISHEEYPIKQGLLNVKIHEEDCEPFGVRVIEPVYGYLFKPDEHSISGVYKRALFPGSLVKAPEVLIEKETYYDE